MAAGKLILSWHIDKGRSGGRWRKYVNGRARYFGHGKSRTDRNSYRAAIKAYFEFMKELDEIQPVEIQIQNATVTDVCEKFVQQLEERYKRDEISANYVEQTRCSLTDFATFVGATSKFSTVRELRLDDYRSHTLNQPISQATGRRISLKTAKGRLGAVRTLFRWAYKMYLIENIPRNMMDFTDYPWPKAQVKVYTTEELKTLWKASNDRLRCWIALALNCGMGQKDISDLRAKEIDWQGDCIERERSKTGIKAKHKLWDVTLRLLRKEMEPDAAGDDRVFLTKPELSLPKNEEPWEKQPLVRKGLHDGKFWMSDAVKSAFSRVQVKTKINGGRGFYCLRKTGATLIETIDPRVTEMYLSHAENGMKQAYAERDWGRLERALLIMADKLKDVLAMPDTAGSDAEIHCGEGI